MALSVVSIWMRNQIEDTDRYMRTVGPLADDPAIQEAIVVRVTDRFSAFLDDATTRDTLVDRQRYLAGPLTSLLENFVEDTVRSFVTSDQFPQYWIQANEIVHPRVSAILTGSSTEHLTTADGKVTLDLTPLVEAIKGRLSDRGVDIFDKVPGDRLDPQVVIVDSPELAKVQDLVNLLDSLALVLPILSLLAVGGYIWFSPNHRRAVIWSGLGLAIAMGALLMLLGLARSLYLDGLDSDVSRNATTAFFDTIGRYFRYAARALAVLGLLVAAIAIATRPGSWLRQERSAITTQISDIWGKVKSKFLRPAVESGWTGRHRAALLTALIAVCILAIVLWDRTALGWAATLALITAIGITANRLLQGPATTLQASPADVGLGLVTPATVAKGATLRPDVQTADAGEAADNALLAITRDLSPEDLQVLQRLAVGLRQTSQS
jgi:hypothetical protein